MAGAIALAAVFLIAVVEMIFSPGRNCCAYPVFANGQDVEMTSGITQRDCCLPAEADAGSTGAVTADCPADQSSQIHGRARSTGRELQRLAGDNANLDRNLTGGDAKVPTAPNTDKICPLTADRNAPISPPSEIQKQRKALVQCFLLEVGILFHSIFIGMAVSVAVGNDFIVLLIAITFHQTFEGLALGSRIASLDWRRNTYQPWIMACVYGRRLGKQ
ncbi:MAG: hypothetical protein M1825_001522 [Sarcosagium campestre]|nr:MAG: hypothetical protein M1825_001522 [Sarcosagium campestre]